MGMVMNAGALMKADDEEEAELVSEVMRMSGGRSNEDELKDMFRKNKSTGDKSI